MRANEQLCETSAEADAQLDSLAHVARRRLLWKLLDRTIQRDDPLRVDGLVDVAGDRSSAIDMRHRHLPKLDDHGFVDWDRERGVVTRGAAFDRIEPLLTVLDDNPDQLPDGWL